MLRTKKMHTNGPLGRAATAGTVVDRAEALKRAASTDLPKFQRELLRSIADRSPSVRGQAVLLVSEHGLVDALPLVLPLLRDSNAEVRYNAAECVGLLQINTGQVYATLRALLSDKERLVRIQAAESLALIGDRGALPKLAQLLSDRDSVVRSYAATAIADLNGSAYARDVEKALRAEKEELARVGLLEASYRFGRREVLGELLSLLRSDDYHVRCAVANALEFLAVRRSERTLVFSALKRAARAPLAFADGSSAKRVLRQLKRAD